MRGRRFLAEAVRSDEASQQTTGEGVRLRTHLHHAYLPPVEVELTAELGGAVDKLSDCRTVIVHVSPSSLAHDRTHSCRSPSGPGC